MKQFNVRDETHALGRELSYKTGKSLIVVVQEAMELYSASLEESESDGESMNVLIDRLLREASGVMEEELCAVMCSLVHREVTRAVAVAIEKLYEERAKESERQAQLLREADDLPVVSYEEAYGSDGDGEAPMK